MVKTATNQNGESQNGDTKTATIQNGDRLKGNITDTTTKTCGQNGDKDSKMLTDNSRFGQLGDIMH